MTKKVGFLGCGKIGGAMLHHLQEQGVQVTFIQDIFCQGETDIPVISAQDTGLLEGTDLVVECATAQVLKENVEGILTHSDLMVFSVTAFADEDFSERVRGLMAETGHKVYLPHGAILGLDGLFDGRHLFDHVHTITTKNPPSLGRSDTEVTVVYEGNTRQVCQLYPRNVNVHAAIALATLGFDRCTSTIISDPSVSTNAHKIMVSSEGIHFELNISSFTTGGVTGKYTPFSACGSLDRVLELGEGFRFV